MKRNLVEWAVLATSIVAIGLVVAILALEGISEERPANPRVTLLVDEARTGASGWILPATVVNEGDAAAAAVLFEATATVDGEEEVSAVQVAFLPAGTDVEVAFVFSAEPGGEVTVRLASFGSP